VDVGVDMLELDCHMTKDGEVVVSHDDDLSRVTGIPVRISDTLFKVAVLSCLSSFPNDLFFGVCCNSTLCSLCILQGWSGSVGSIVDCINEVNQHQARLVLG